MTRLAVTLGIVAAVSSFAMGFSENFESYNVAQPIAGTNDWQQAGSGGNFQAEATVQPGDPSVLGLRYADLSRNDNPVSNQSGWLWRSFDSVSSGMLLLEFDARFQAAHDLDSCAIYLCSPDRTPELSPDDQTVGVSVDLDGLRVYDGGWRVVTNFGLQNDTWYHVQVAVDLDEQTWQLAMGAYVGDDYQTLTTVSYSGDDTFTFIDPTVTEIGRIEFATTPDIMGDATGRGFHVDNVSVPEPATLSLLALAAAMTLRRRKQ